MVALLSFIVPAASQRFINSNSGFSGIISGKTSTTLSMSTATKNDNRPPQANHEIGAGYLEISEKGFGFLRTAENHFHPKPADIFVTPDTIKRNFLREGSL